MKKKIISCILTLVIVFSALSPCLGVSGAEAPLRGMDYIAKRLTMFTHEDRSNLETIFIPLLITDAGLNALVDMVGDYTPESEAFMHVMLTKLLVRVEKEEVIKALSYLYMIDEKVRENYIGGYYERKELKLSAEGAKSMTTLMNGFFSKYPDLREVFEQDGITGGVIARVMKMFSVVNGNGALFKRSSNGKLALNYIDPAFKSKIEACLAGSELGYSSAEELLNKVCADLNEDYRGVYMDSFIAVGAETGIVLMRNQSANSSVSSKNTLTDIGLDFDPTANRLTVKATDSGGLVHYSGEYNAFAISFECGVKGYLIDPDGMPVRLCAYENGIWYALLTKLGTYMVKESADSYFYDVDGWGKDYINPLFERGIISGRSAEVFSPDDNITRDEFVKLIVELFGLKGDYGNYFSDVKTDAWYYEYVSAAKFYGIVDGYLDSTFGVGKNITRQDMCKILYSVMQQMEINTKQSGLALEFADGHQIADYAYQSVMALRRAGIVSGDDKGRFNPANNATRQEAAKLIYNILLSYVKY